MKVKSKTSTSRKPPRSSSSSQKPPSRKVLTDGGEYIQVHRSQLNPAPYNPRVIHPEAEHGLRDSIRESGGLVECPVWNRRTGHLVAGHQRINQLDRINGTQDYSLTCCVVDIPLEQEMELNIRLNNPQIQGEYDIPRLLEVLEQPGIDLSATGFDPSTLEALLIEGGHDLPEWMTGMDPRAVEEEQEILSEARELLNEADQFKNAQKRQRPGGVQEDRESDEEDQEEDQEEDRDAEYKEKKRKFREEQSFKNQLWTFVRVVFPSDGTLQAFLRKLQMNPEAGYVDGLKMLERLGHDPEELMDEAGDLPPRTRKR